MKNKRKLKILSLLIVAIASCFGMFYGNKGFNGKKNNNNIIASKYNVELMDDSINYVNKIRYFSKDIVNKDRISFKCGTSVYVVKCVTSGSNHSCVFKISQTLNQTYIVNDNDGKTFVSTQSALNCPSTTITTQAKASTYVNTNRYIDFKGNGGTISGKPSCNADKTICTETATSTSGYNVTLPSVTWANHTFKGWSKGTKASSDCSNIIATSGSYTVNGGSTYLYACWTGTTTASSCGNQAYRYTSNNSSAGGSGVSCGDKVTLNGNTVESACKNGICNISTINGTPVKSDQTSVYASTLGCTFESRSCGDIVRYVSEGYSYTDAALTKGEEAYACASKVIMKSPTTGLSSSVGDSCNGSSCYVELNGKNVYINNNNFYSSASIASSNCEASKYKCTPSEIQKNVEKSVDVNFCGYRKSSSVQVFTKKADTDATKLVQCKDSAAKAFAVLKDGSDCDKTAIGKKGKLECTWVYTVTCVSGVRPSISVSGSTVGANGTGSLTITAKDNGSGVNGYFVSNGNAPTTDTSKWLSFDRKDNDKQWSTTVSDKGSGTYYAWAINSSNGVSYPVYTTIFSSDSSTTVNSFSATDANGASVTLNQLSGGTTGYVEGNVVSSEYVRLSNNLNNDSTIASFDPFATGYEVTVNSNKIAVYATLTSTDASYVEGYEPRTVNLDYGRNVILIKIQNKKGHIRTYTIIVNRPDNRENINLLTNLTVSAGNITFDPYIANYTIEVPKNTKTVSINGTLESTNASFVEDYAPRKVTLTSDITSAVLKVLSESGSVRAYVLTFVKSGADETESSKNSTYLNSLAIPGTFINFDKETDHYTVTTGYENDTLPIYAFPESYNAKVTIEGNDYLNVGDNTINIIVTNGSKTRNYTITLIRKEDGLGISDDTALGTLTVKGYNINFDANTLDYVLKIKHEKTLVITASPHSDRSDVYMYGNNDLTGFSTVRIKVIAENGETKIYSIDIRKDAYNKTLEITAAIVGGVIIIGAAIIITIRRKRKKMKDYIGE